MKKIFFILITIISIILTFAGCRKDVAPVANPVSLSYGHDLIEVDTFYVASTSWVQVTPADFTYTHTASNVTQNVINAGNIKVLVALSGNWIECPATTSAGVYLSVSYRLNTIILKAENVSSSSLPGISYKAVVTP